MLSHPVIICFMFCGWRDPSSLTLSFLIHFLKCYLYGFTQSYYYKQHPKCLHTCFCVQAHCSTINFTCIYLQTPSIQSHLTLTHPKSSNGKHLGFSPGVKISCENFTKPLQSTTSLLQKVRVTSLSSQTRDSRIGKFPSLQSLCGSIPHLGGTGMI